MGIVSKLADRHRPQIDELLGVPEIFCEVGLVKSAGETVRIVLARAMAETGPPEMVGVLFMPRSGFLRSLRWAAEDFLLG